MNTQKRKRRTFHGIDWMELVTYWNIKTRNMPVEEWMEEHADRPDAEIVAWDRCVVEKCIDYMHDAIIKGGPRLKEVAQDARCFLRALAKSSQQSDYCAPVWEGMLNIKNDAGGNETLLKFIAIYLDAMWT